MIEAIHQSNLGMALRCGEQFRRRYIEDEIIPPSIAAGRGTGVHKANKVNLEYKIRKGEDMPLSDIEDATRDGYVRALRNGVFIPEDELSSKDRLLNEGLEDALRCAKLYRNEVAPSINPIAVEEKFIIDVGLSLPLAGTMDYQEKPLVGDLKTSSSKWPDGRINTEIQPVFYSYVHEHTKGIRPEFIYHILIARRGKNGPTSEELQEQSMKPTQANYRALFAKIDSLFKMLQTGTFPPASPGMYYCSPKWCGYWSTCPFVGNAWPKNWF